MHDKVLFFPEQYAKQSKSFASLKASACLLSSQQNRKHFALSGMRRNLPQTSNRFLGARLKHKQKPRDGDGQADKNCLSSLSSPYEWTVAEDISSKLSPTLSKLLKKVSKFYKDCEIIPDNSYPQHGLYCYLFDSHCKRIEKFSDIRAKPEFLFISCRFNLPDLIFPAESKARLEQSQGKGLNCVNLYSSIMSEEKQGMMSSVNKKKARSPLYKLKNIKSTYKLSRTPEIKAYPACSDVKPIFPCASGKKLIEGTGGFRRPQLFFDKRKASAAYPSHHCERNYELTQKSSQSPGRHSVKDSLGYD